jgi:hypothetical protein
MLPGDQANSSVISIPSQVVITANGIAQSLKKGAQEKPLRRVHVKTLQPRLIRERRNLKGGFFCLFFVWYLFVICLIYAIGWM